MHPLAMELKILQFQITIQFLTLQKMSSKKSSIVILRSLIIFFKILGLVPFKVCISSKTGIITSVNYKLRDCLYNLLLLLCLIAAFYYRNLKNPEVKFEIKSINDFSETVYIIMDNITATIILLSYAKNQRTATDIFRRLISLSSDLSDSNLAQKKFLAKETPICSLKSGKMIFIIAIQIFLTIFLFVLETIQNKKTSLYNITRSIPLFIIACFIIQYAIIVIHLEDLFCKMNSALLRIKNLAKCSQIEIEPERSLEGLKKVKRIYRRLREVCEMVSNFNSWPILFVFIHFCPALTYSCWRLYNNFSEDKFIEDLTEKKIKCLMTALWIVKNLYPTSALIVSIILLFITKIDKIVCEIGRSSLNIRIRDQAEQFAMELLHKNINFNAFGFFSIQGSCLISLLHTALSYTFIIINYRDDNENNSTK
ncbi:GSCOCT00013844001.3-RA-CDS [Cotesia congregata]|uniref:Gustatory receptor n=1 Tax=Cotesia congregata TaxID=51543 RepID=A0A8J2H3V2_COTCN|nr:GSCOCT00013844001.3-RA-CDS [Cotesia congregata]CAG5076396.1 gustatory receptor 412.1 [Cotesia congregata]